MGDFTNIILSGLKSSEGRKEGGGERRTLKDLCEKKKSKNLN